MDIARTRALLDAIPVRTEYEFRNFEIESQGSWHRQMRYVLSQKEQLTDQLESTTAQIEPVSYTHLTLPTNREV